MEGDNKVVLLADDEADFREIFSIKLKKAGYTIIEASDGAEAVEKAKEHHPDLILMDVKMPGTDGIQAFFKLREANQNIKVIFLTNFAEPRSEAAAIDDKFAAEIGAVDYIKKTEDADDVVAKVNEIIAQQKR